MTSWNHGAERLFGYSEAEAIGQHIFLIIPDGRRAEEEDVLARVRRGEKVDHFETVRRTKDGRRVPISLANARKARMAHCQSRHTPRTIGVTIRLEMRSFELSQKTPQDLGKAVPRSISAAPAEPLIAGCSTLRIDVAPASRRSATS